MHFFHQHFLNLSWQLTSINTALFSPSEQFWRWNQLNVYHIYLLQAKHESIFNISFSDSCCILTLNIAEGSFMVSRFTVDIVKVTFGLNFVFCLNNWDLFFGTIQTFEQCHIQKHACFKEVLGQEIPHQALFDNQHQKNYEFCCLSLILAEHGVSYAVNLRNHWTYFDNTPKIARYIHKWITWFKKAATANYPEQTQR